MSSPPSHKSIPQIPPTSPLSTTTNTLSSPPSQKPIPQIPPTSPLPPPTHPTEQDIDDVPLNVLHPQIPKRPRKHIAIKQKPSRKPVTRSTSMAKMTDGATSSVKDRHSE